MSKFLFSVMICVLAISCVQKKEVPKMTLKVIEGCSIKATSDYQKSDIIGVLNVGEVVEKIGIFGDYIKVTIKPISNIITGYTWVGLYSNIPNTQNWICIAKSGAFILTKPTKNSTPVGTVLCGQTVTAIDTEVTWYNIKKINGMVGWAYFKYLTNN